MGTWGVGLWSDDTASDVRSTYKEMLEDGLSDDEAQAAMMTKFASDLEDQESSGVFWLSLASCQHHLGRLDPLVLMRALEVIDDGSDLRRWDAVPQLRVKRDAVLTKLRQQLLGKQPERKTIRRPAKPQTSLVVGSLLAYSAVSGRIYLLAVIAINESRYGTFPVVQLLDYESDHFPDEKEQKKLKNRKQGKKPIGDKPAEPWWAVLSQVSHKIGRDFSDLGFMLIGDLTVKLNEEQKSFLIDTRSYTTWEFWQKYLTSQDSLLTERTRVP